MAVLFETLNKNPYLGIPLGKDCYKIRLNIKSKRKGKSGGARVITHIFVSNEMIYLLTIYDKSEKQDLTENELSILLNNLEKE